MFSGTIAENMRNVKPDATDGEIQAVLETACTCIATTHRPTVLSLCGRVYAISNKRCKILNQEEIDTLIRTF